MAYGFGIGSCGLKADNNFLKHLFFFKVAKPFPKLVEAITGVMKRKWLKIFARWGSKITVMNLFTNVQSSNKCFFVDRSDFFGFTMFHGYTPFLNPDYQPTYCNWNRIEYSLFYLGSRLTAI
jgi:hypothetical protein